MKKKKLTQIQIQLQKSFWYVISICTLLRTPTQRGHYHHGMFRNPTAAVNLFHVGKQYLTFWQAKAAVTRNLIGREIMSNVKRSDTRNTLHTVAFVKVD